MTDQHVKSPRWDHCATCHYPWPCREALREGLATIVGAYTTGAYCFDCGGSLDADGCDCVISVARALLAQPAGEGE